MFLLFDNKKVFWDLEKECYIVAGESNHPEHCYLDTNKNKVISISEKKKISNLAIVGCYIFKSADTYLNLYEKAKQNLKKDKEFYISDVVKESVVRNTCGHILADTYLSLGTPAEVGISEPYLKNLFNSDCF
jgi:dTDP-glucose pyrophosphorylase